MVVPMVVEHRLHRPGAQAVAAPVFREVNVLSHRLQHALLRSGPESAQARSLAPSSGCDPPPCNAPREQLLLLIENAAWIAVGFGFAATSLWVVLNSLNAWLADPVGECGVLAREVAAPHGGGA